MGSLSSVFIAFFQFYVEYNLKKIKIVLTSTTDFFRH
jgi:hypothetical protein